jgi:dTDP-4-dehydrorhamnose 3,5-epimerase
VRVTPTALPGVVLIEPVVHRDPRGFFLETYHRQRYAEAGIGGDFVQDNHSRSTRGTLRGLHAQVAHAQGKIVRAVFGEVFDVAVDIRRGSPTFARWVGVVLTGENYRQLYIPPGFAHGLCVLSESVDVAYKCTDFYAPADEITVAWNDPEIGIEWPLQEPVLSPKDASAACLRDLVDRLPEYGGGRAPR